MPAADHVWTSPSRTSILSDLAQTSGINSLFDLLYNGDLSVVSIGDLWDLSAVGSGRFMEVSAGNWGTT